MEDELENKAHEGFILQTLRDRGYDIKDRKVPDRENTDEDQKFFEEEYRIRSPRGSWAHMTIRCNNRRFYGKRINKLEVEELGYRH